MFELYPSVFYILFYKLFRVIAEVEEHTHLEIHDGLGDFDVYGLHNHHNVERAEHAFRHLVHGQGKVLPLGVELVQVV